MNPNLIYWLVPIDQVTMIDSESKLIYINNIEFEYLTTKEIEHGDTKGLLILLDRTKEVSDELFEKVVLSDDKFIESEEEDDEEEEKTEELSGKVTNTTANLHNKAEPLRERIDKTIEGVIEFYKKNGRMPKDNPQDFSESSLAKAFNRTREYFTKKKLELLEKNGIKVNVKTKTYETIILKLYDNKHKCFDCKKALPNKCPKVTDTPKKGIPGVDYPFIIDGFRSSNKDKEIERYVVASCKDFEMDDTQEERLKQLRESERLQEVIHNAERVKEIGLLGNETEEMPFYTNDGINANIPRVTSRVKKDKRYYFQDRPIK